MNQVNKQHELTINISPANRSNIITNTTFFTQDVKTAKKIINFTQNNAPVDLTNATVLLGFEFVGAGASKIIDSGDGSVVIEEATEGKCSVVLPNHLYDYQGQVLVHVYIKYEDGRSLDCGVIVTEFEESWLDKDVKEMEQFYVQRFENLATAIKKRASELEERLLEVEERLSDAENFRGPMGPQGEQGIQGERGHQGERGEIGPQGEQGVAGPVGHQGVAGPMGPQGERGQTGERGAIGPAGPQGIAGPMGPPGADGATTWEDITNRPATFPPTNHPHTIEEVKGLQERLDSVVVDHQTQIPNGTDLNTILTPGIWRQRMTVDTSNIRNRPAGRPNEAFSLEVIFHGGDGGVHQIYRPFSTPRIWTRTRAINWRPWEEVAMVGNNAHSHNASAINAGTLGIERLPIGTEAGTVALGDHTHPLPTTVTGNAGTATTLETPRTINGTSFNGSEDITTNSWGAARNITIGNATHSVDGSENLNWTVANILGTVAGGSNAAGSARIGNLLINWGRVTLGTGVNTATVNFRQAYTAIPAITTSVSVNNISVSALSQSANGFVVSRHTEATGGRLPLNTTFTAGWIAIGLAPN